MCRKTSNASAYFCCGSYVRYGPAVCAKHTIREEALTGIVLSDLNKIIASAPDLDGLVRETTEQTPRNRRAGERHEQLEDALSRIRRLKKSSYEDYCDRLLSRKEFRHYKAEYDEQERTLKTQLRHLAEDAGNEKPRNDWAEKLLAKGRLEALDRATAVQTIEQIKVFVNRRIEIRYRFDPQSPSILGVVSKGHGLRMKKLQQRLDFLDREFGFRFPDSEIKTLYSLSNPGKPHIAKS